MSPTARGRTVDESSAEALLDFGARIGPGKRADEQLHGAVALHNLLQENGVAYLADEVGMGKTYVALGALALFRHHDPGFRALVIAPRKNIQQKWMKEAGNFAANNLRFADMRTSSFDRRPARQMVFCDNLVAFAHEAAIGPDRDFFLRMTSFSLQLGNERAGWDEQRTKLLSALPWLSAEPFDLRSTRDKEAFKDNFARAICCAMPVFDLVIIDEAHNLKHGFGEGVAARNRVLGLSFGRPGDTPSRKWFPGYGPRAKRVLFLSATPLEESYHDLWNQLDVMSFGGPFEDLRNHLRTEEEQRRLVSRFLVRRVTKLHVHDQDLTKNQYRREWRRGGVSEHDEPMKITDDRQRLVVALVQKKVSELLGSGRMIPSFQIGMLASFESFLQTTATKREEDGTDGTFDDADQTDDAAEKEGIDVRQVNSLSKSYRKAFQSEMPHPKMDAIVDRLAASFRTGEKALLFVRRVASVKELKAKLDRVYDGWLSGLLHERLPESAHAGLERVEQLYREEKGRGRPAGSPAPRRAAEGDDEEEGSAGDDTFFAWFFRGEGPPGVVSGATLARRTADSTFFEDNHVMDLLGARPGEVLSTLARALGRDVEAVRRELRSGAAGYLKARSAEHSGPERMEAAQGAALEMLWKHGGEHAEAARVIWHARYEPVKEKDFTRSPPDVADWLEQRTFFTEIARPEWAALRACLWPAPESGEPRQRFVERELRAQLLASAARLGHALIDLYVLTIQRAGTLERRANEARERGDEVELRRIDEYLELLDRQRRTPRADRPFGAFDELSEIAENFELLLDVNAPGAKDEALGQTARTFGRLLRQQQPIGGMAGQINRTLVQQFRMPGYPFVLVTTELLQEGEDLHTFCSSIHHYGISWTPSSMEQRVGRIDRVRSQTDRRLGKIDEIGRLPDGGERLQVHYPHLEDTVEVLQVRRVFARMNTFLRRMHEGLTPAADEQKRIDVGKELVEGPPEVEAITETLESAFPVRPSMRKGDVLALAVSPEQAAAARARFSAIRSAELRGVEVTWEHGEVGESLLGTVKLPGDRIQPMRLVLSSYSDRLAVRALSPVGLVNLGEAMDAVSESVKSFPVRIGAAPSRKEQQYNLTVEDVVLLAAPEHDAARVGALIARVARRADALERVHLPDKDQPLHVFRKDLLREGADETD